MTGETVGFIGLGIMGQPMARNVMAAGYDVVVHNRSRGPVHELVETGAEPADSSAAVAQQSDVVITVLPEIDAVETVALGEEGVLAGIDEGTTYIDMSTISSVATELIAAAFDKQGAAMLDTPISGGEEGAVDATLSIMLGGDGTCSTFTGSSSR